MPQVVFNTRSQRAGVVLPAPSRMFDDGGEQQRVRLIQAFRRGIESRFETEREPSKRRTGGPSCANAVASGPRRDAGTSSGTTHVPCCPVDGLQTLGRRASRFVDALERTLAAIADIPELRLHLSAIDEGEADGKIAFVNRAAYGRSG